MKHSLLQSVGGHGKKSFLDFITFTPQDTPTTPLDEQKKLKLLRFNLGIVGQRYFDALKLDERKSLGAALLELDSIWDQTQNLFLQRYKFQQLRQQDDETVDQFINRPKRS